MQEPKDDKDAEIMKEINDFIDKPPANAMQNQGQAGYDQAAMMNMMGGQGTPGQPQRPHTSPAGLSSYQTPQQAPAAAPTAPAPVAAPSTLTPATPAAGAGPTAPAGLAAALTKMAEQYQTQSQGMELSGILEADRVMPALSESDIAALLEHLPEGQRTPHGLQTSLRSPQLRQTLQRLSGILNSEQYAALMASLGLPTGAPGVSAFVDAVEDQVREEEAKKD
jgi:hypothetical protein